MNGRNIIKVFLLCSLVFLSVTPVFAKPKKVVRPDWVDNPWDVYSQDAYFSNVGYGSTKEIADANAINGLASIFGQTVKSSSTASKRMLQAKADGKVSTFSAEGFEQNIGIEVDIKDLIGVEIKEFWFDEKETWYSIAVLDKLKASMLYRNLIEKNILAISQLVSQARSDPNSIDAYCCFDLAAEIAFETEDYTKRLTVINPNSMILREKFFSSNELKIMRNETAKSIPISVYIEGDEDNRITPKIKKILSDNGFKAKSTDEDRYLIQGSVTYESSPTSDGTTIRCRYNLELYLLDQETGNETLEYSANGRESQLSYLEARNRANKTLEKKIDTEFRAIFEAFLGDFNINE